MKLYSNSSINVIVIVVAMLLLLTSSGIGGFGTVERSPYKYKVNCYKTYSHCTGSGKQSCIHRCQRKGFVVGQCSDSFKCRHSARFQCFCHGHYAKSNKTLDD